MTVIIRCADCLDILPQIKDKSIHAIICDMPYGTTKCKWDVLLPLDVLWREMNRIIKLGGAIVMFCSQPFTTILISSNLKDFKYCWTWDKKTGKGHLVAKHRPLQQTEDIAVFGKGKITYNPIMVPREKPEKISEGRRSALMDGDGTKDSTGYTSVRTEWYPKTILSFPWSPTVSFHPTQKPTQLLEYLIKTYTNEGEWVLDFTMGSGSVGVAALNLNRNFLGIEKDAGYFKIAEQRITEAEDTRRKISLLTTG